MFLQELFEPHHRGGEVPWKVSLMLSNLITTYNIKITATHIESHIARHIVYCLHLIGLLEFDLGVMQYMISISKPELSNIDMRWQYCLCRPNCTVHDSSTAHGEILPCTFRTLPRAIWISVPMITVLYICANIAFFTVLSKEEMLSADAVAVVGLFFSNPCAFCKCVRNNKNLQCMCAEKYRKQLLCWHNCEGVFICFNGCTTKQQSGLTIVDVMVSGFCASQSD